MDNLTAFNFRDWIESRRHLLKPPVCNQQVFEEGDLIIMVVGGPNARADYHVDKEAEFFYQLEGDMELRTIQNGRRVDIPIREGDVLMLPPGVPHSPVRHTDSIGLVVERKRNPGEEDGFLWFCDACDQLLHEEYLYVEDIVADLPPVFERFYSSKDLRTCKQCGTVAPRPEKSDSQ